MTDEKIIFKRDSLTIGGTPTLKELILCLPMEDRKKVLKMVEAADEEVSACDIGAVISQYAAIEKEIKKYVVDKEKIK